MSALSEVTLAIDPGKKGAIAVGTSWTDFVNVYSMPGTDTEIKELLFGLLDQAADRRSAFRVVMEKVSGFMGRKTPAHHGFVFGENYGYIRGLLEGRNTPLQLVAPQEWQKGVGAGTKRGRTDPAWKRHLRDLASRTFGRRLGQTRTTLVNSDALLILHYAETKLGSPTQRVLPQPT
jgi:hypothetical protein